MPSTSKKTAKTRDNYDWNPHYAPEDGIGTVTDNTTPSMRNSSDKVPKKACQRVDMEVRDRRCLIENSPAKRGVDYTHYFARKKFSDQDLVRVLLVESSFL